MTLLILLTSSIISLGNSNITIDLANSEEAVYRAVKDWTPHYEIVFGDQKGEGKC